MQRSKWNFFMSLHLFWIFTICPIFAPSLRWCCLTEVRWNVFILLDLFEQKYSSVGIWRLSFFSYEILASGFWCICYLTCANWYIIFAEWYAFIGKRADQNVPGSPYAIDFRSDVDESSGMKLMNVTTYSCSDTSLGCSCGDCATSVVCANSAPPLSQKTAFCSVRIGSLKVREEQLHYTYWYLLHAILVSCLYSMWTVSACQKYTFSSKIFTPTPWGYYYSVEFCFFFI